MFLMQSTLLVVYLSTLPSCTFSLMVGIIVLYQKPLSSNNNQPPCGKHSIKQKNILYKIENYFHGSGRYKMHFEWNPSGFVLFFILFLLFLFYIFLHENRIFKLQSKQAPTTTNTSRRALIFIYLYLPTLGYKLYFSLLIFILNFIF